MQEQTTKQANTKPTWQKDFLEKKPHLKQVLESSDIAFSVPSPSYVLCAKSLESNAILLEQVAKDSSAHILVALKGYSFWRHFGVLREKLSGATCSGVYEARLAFDSIALPSLQEKSINAGDQIDSDMESLMLACFSFMQACFGFQKEIINETMHYKTMHRGLLLQQFIECYEKTDECGYNSDYYKEKDSTTIAQDAWQTLCEKIPYALFSSYAKKDICVFAPAYKESQMQEILQYATHIIFNSLAQWEQLYPMIEEKNARIAAIYAFLQEYERSNNVSLNLPKKIPQIEVGLRINPLYSEVTPPIYNPCIPKSRLGIIPSVFARDIENLAKKYGFKDSISFFKKHFQGLHFHTHCEQDSSALERTLPHVMKHFSEYIAQCEWVNFGGGHHITRDDYDCTKLLQIIRDFRTQYNVEVFLEPGEAVGWQTGDLIGEVVSIVENDGLVAILDVSASCHMPDCLEMPYRPECYKISKDSCGNAVIESDLGENKGAFSYRFGGPTCLAGDVIGDYSFASELKVGDRVAFVDMIHYTIVKNTTFNGVELPSLCVVENNTLQILKQFSYNDFKERN